MADDSENIPVHQLFVSGDPVARELACGCVARKLSSDEIYMDRACPTFKILVRQLLEELNTRGGRPTGEALCEHIRSGLL